MSLPKGFGRDWDTPSGGDKPTRTCKLGQPCAKFEECKYHKWIKDNSFEIFRGTIIGLLVLAAAIAIAVVFYNQSTIDKAYPIIEGFNCQQLAEYIANKDIHYRYAEHRYEWLCVNEQVKEFQG